VGQRFVWVVALTSSVGMYGVSLPMVNWSSHVIGHNCYIVVYFQSWLSPACSVQFGSVNNASSLVSSYMSCLVC